MQLTMCQQNGGLGTTPYLLLSLFLLGSAIGCAPTTPATAIGQVLRRHHEEGSFSGVALVAQKGKVLYEQAFGLANIEWGIPNAIDTRFKIGSVTKQFTALLVLTLVDEGALSLSGTVGEYLPSYPGGSSDRITIHQLLTHTSGLPDLKDLGERRLAYSGGSSPEEFLMLFQDLRPMFEPGTKFSYSNLGYLLLGAIIESVAGVRYDRLLREKIFDPLEMRATGFDDQVSIVAGSASGYERATGGYRRATRTGRPRYFSDAGLYSTARDLLKWSEGLESGVLLPQELTDRFLSPHVAVRDGGYGYGWFFASAPYGPSGHETRIMEHSGAVPGFNCLMTRVIDDATLIVLLHNTGHTDLAQIRDEIIEALYWDPNIELHQATDDERTHAATRSQETTAGQPARGNYFFPLEMVWQTNARDHLLRECGGLAALPDGKVWIQDNGDKLFHVLDSDGTIIRTIAEGENTPADIKAVDRAQLHAVDGEIVIVDNAVLHYFTGVGQYVESVDLTSSPCDNFRAMPVSVSFLSRQEFVWAPLLAPLGSSARGAVTYCNLREGSQRQVSEFPLFRGGSSQRGDKAVAVIYPPVTPTMILGSDGTRVFFGMSDQHEITETDISGRIQHSFRIDRARQPVGEAERERIVAKWQGRIPAPMLNDIKQGLPGEATLFHRIEVQGEHVLVFASHLFPESTQCIDIFSRDGDYRYRASLTVADSLMILNSTFTEQYVYLVLEDSDGGIRVAKFRTSLPPF